MLEKLQTLLSQSYDLKETHGLFVSAYNASHQLLSPNGVLESNKSLGDTLALLYNGILQNLQGVKTVVLDVITDLKQEQNIQELPVLNLKERGVYLVSVVDQKSGVILPNTQGVNDIKTAFASIKQKHGLTGNVTIYLFTTKRIVVSL